MPEPDLALLQSLVERVINERRTDSERLERVERLLLHLTRTIEALPDRIALELSTMFERRLSHIEEKLDERDQPPRPPS